MSAWWRLHQWAPWWRLQRWECTLKEQAGLHGGEEDRRCSVGWQEKARVHARKGHEGSGAV